jgi:hypothetical protein
MEHTAIDRFGSTYACDHRRNAYADGDPVGESTAAVTAFGLEVWWSV